MLAIALVASMASGQLSYVNVGTACAVTATTCTPTINASGALNDVHIAVLHSRTNTAHTCTTNCTGWTEFSTQAGGTGGRLSVWYLRQTGASPPGNPTFGGPATESYTGRIWTFRGVKTTGNPYNVLGTNTNVDPAASTFTGGTLVTTVDDCWVVFVGGSMDNNTWGASGGSCTVPNSADANFYSANNAGTDDSVFLCYGNVGTASTPGTEAAPTNVQATLGADLGRHFTLMLEPEPVTDQQSMMGFW